MTYQVSTARNAKIQAICSGKAFSKDEDEKIMQKNSGISGIIRNAFSPGQNNPNGNHGTILFPKIQTGNTHAIEDTNNNMRGLEELLKIDTSASNTTFLEKFRNLKREYPIIKELCQPRSGYGLLKLGYALKRDKQKAERYKKIIEQLKSGAPSSKEKSYFNTSTYKVSVYQKVQQITNDFLANTYNVSAPDSTSIISYVGTGLLTVDKKDYAALIKLRKNLNQEIQTSHLESIKLTNELRRTDKTWTAFLEVYPQYAILNLGNQFATNQCNIEGKTMDQLRQEALVTIMGPGSNTNTSYEDKLKLRETALFISPQILTHRLSNLIECKMEVIEPLNENNHPKQSDIPQAQPSMVSRTIERNAKFVSTKSVIRFTSTNAATLLKSEATAEI